jgi:NADH-quinone oxidoreductase subunit D
MALDSRSHTLHINMGPQHPSTHGVLRLELELDGEIVVRCKPVIGYLHTGIEKSMESRNYLHAITMTDRTDYLNPLGNNLAYALAVEKLFDCEIPERAQVARVLLAELTRINSHLVFTGTSGMDLGASSVFLYALREREMLLDLFEEMSGARMMTSFIRPGGLAGDLTPELLAKIRGFLNLLPSRIDEYESLLRKANPYSGYERFEFNVPIRTNGDAYDRYIVRIAEMRESIKLCHQALDMLPEGPVRTSDRKVMPPTRLELQHSMESLIHHFKLYTEGLRPPAGEAYVGVESPRGELGFYVVSDGSGKPVRIHERAPSYFNLQALPLMVEGTMVADAVAIIASTDPIMGEVDR